MEMVYDGTQRVFEVTWLSKSNIKCVYAGTEAECKRVYTTKQRQIKKGLIRPDCNLKMEPTDRFI